ncbi:MAG: YceI family protein, partial [Flavobacterium sp.]|nr:YceI family protein [Flavobacterium sp.]
MKKILILFLLSLSVNAIGQKMISRTGEIKFDATVPGSLDVVAASDNTVSAVLDKATGDFVVQSMVKSFKFKSPLMQEHFNENYMESDKFPKATFKGKIIKYDQKSG